MKLMSDRTPFGPPPICGVGVNAGVATGRGAKQTSEFSAGPTVVDRYEYTSGCQYSRYLGEALVALRAKEVGESRMDDISPPIPDGQVLG